MKQTLLLLGAFALTSMAHAQFIEGRITVDYWDKDEFNQLTIMHDTKYLNKAGDIAKDIQINPASILVKSESQSSQRVNRLTGEVKITRYIQAREINCPISIKLNIADRVTLHLDEESTRWNQQHPSAQRTYDAPVGSMSASRSCKYTDGQTSDSIDEGQSHYEVILNYPNEIIKMQQK